MTRPPQMKDQMMDDVRARELLLETAEALEQWPEQGDNGHARGRAAEKLDRYAKTIRQAALALARPAPDDAVVAPWMPNATWQETICKLREIKTDDEIEAELCASRHTIEKWATGRGKPRPTVQIGLKRSIAEWLDDQPPTSVIIKVPEADRSDWPQKSAEEISDIIKDAFYAGAKHRERHPDGAYDAAAYDYMMSVGPLVLAKAPVSEDVIQADRDAALALLDHNDPRWWSIKTKRGDGGPLVQAFRRHRLGLTTEREDG